MGCRERASVISWIRRPRGKDCEAVRHGDRHRLDPAEAQLVLVGVSLLTQPENESGCELAYVSGRLLVDGELSIHRFNRRPMARSVRCKETVERLDQDALTALRERRGSSTCGRPRGETVRKVMLIPGPLPVLVILELVPVSVLRFKERSPVARGPGPLRSIGPPAALSDGRFLQRSWRGVKAVVYASLVLIDPGTKLPQPIRHRQSANVLQDWRLQRRFTTPGTVRLPGYGLPKPPLRLSNAHPPLPFRRLAQP
jgi:hypothetical protein